MGTPAPSEIGPAYPAKESMAGPEPAEPGQVRSLAVPLHELTLVADLRYYQLLPISLNLYDGVSSNSHCRSCIKEGTVSF